MFSFFCSCFLVETSHELSFLLWCISSWLLSDVQFFNSIGGVYLFLNQWYFILHNINIYFCGMWMEKRGPFSLFTWLKMPIHVQMRIKYSILIEFTTLKISWHRINDGGSWYIENLVSLSIRKIFNCPEFLVCCLKVRIQLISLKTFSMCLQFPGKNLKLN